MGIFETMIIFELRSILFLMPFAQAYPMFLGQYGNLWDAFMGGSKLLPLDAATGSWGDRDPAELMQEFYGGPYLYKRSAEEQWPTKDFVAFTPPEPAFFGDMTNMQRRILQKLFSLYHGDVHPLDD